MNSDDASRRPAPAPYVLTAGQRRYLAVKRWLDGLTAAVLLLALCVPMGVVALALKIRSPREPVIFRHMRVGRNGELFRLMKFRTMRSGAPRYASSGSLEDGEGYTTRFGDLLRSTSLDELPQLVHVLTGKMALIGPRPLIPQERRVHELRYAAGVYQLRPGLTGWAQIHGRDLVTDAEKAALDRYYLEHVSFALDWEIFWKTIGKVLSREGVRPRENGPKT